MPPKTRRPRPLPAGINPRFIESHSVSARPLTRTNKRAVFHGSKSTPIPYPKKLFCKRIAAKRPESREAPPASKAQFIVKTTNKYVIRTGVAPPSEVDPEASSSDGGQAPEANPAAGNAVSQAQGVQSSWCGL